MKKNRKILALMLAVLMSAVMLVTASGLEIFIIASSDEYESHATAAKYLEILEIMKGYDDGELHLEDPILRYQAALLFARVVTGIVNDTAWGTGASVIYTDVPEYGPVMDLISSLDIIRGYGDGTFGYNDGIRYQDMCAMFVRVLGYETAQMISAYPMSYVVKVEELGFGLKDVMPADYLNRGQVAQMIYDALVTEISVSNDDNLQLIIEILKKEHGGESIDDTKDNYLERNFDVSDRMQFMIVATEHYKMTDTARISKADKGYFTAIELASIERDDDGDITAWTEWNFPIEGEAVNGVTEADLIGKVVNIMFDDRDPTVDEYELDKCTIVHAEMLRGDEFENMGELSYIKFNKNATELQLGNKTVKAEELPEKIYAHSSDEVYVYDNIVAEAADAEEIAEIFKATIEDNTYFKLVAYDYDNDNEYDVMFYTPYQFGQYARRRYDGQFYTMIGTYSDDFVYDTSVTSGETEENKTHFIERFLVTDMPASANLSNYRPADITLVIGDEGYYSLNATVTGESVATGDFMLYSYNMHSGELYVAENLGTFQIGTLSGFDTGAETCTIDGAEMSTGVPGALSVANGLLFGEGAFATAEDISRVILSKYDKGETNVKYLEYDTKLVYLESYGVSARTAASEYAIIDIEETLKAATDADEDAWDIPMDGDSAIVKRLDPATGELSDIQVELLVTHDNTEISFKDTESKYTFGKWPKMNGYSEFRANGAIYAIFDTDKDERYELHAYESEDANIVGAGVVAAADGEPTIEFNYNKSNVFIDPVNNMGFLVDRVASSGSTVSVIVGYDGYVIYKGALGTNTEDKPNELYLSDAAMVLALSDKQLTIFDPSASVILGEDDNVYANDKDSVWYGTRATTVTGAEYYLFLKGSEYIDSAILVDENGDPVLNEDGDILYEHTYKSLYNLTTDTTEDLTVITTDLEPVFEEVENSLTAVLRVDADDYDAQATTFYEVFVENDIYHEASITNFFTKDRLGFALQDKYDKNGVLIEGYQDAFDSNSDNVYGTLDGLTYTLIDFDEGADVDPEEYSFNDAYLFYQNTESNLKNYSVVSLEDRVRGEDGYASSTVPIKRHYYLGVDYTGNIANGAITTGLENGAVGQIYAQPYFGRTNYADYLIPAVDEDGETIWKYEGSLRVRVSYTYYAYYDEEANSLEFIAIRTGKIEGVVGEDVNIDPDDLNDYLKAPVDTPDEQE